MTRWITITFRVLGFAVAALSSCFAIAMIWDHDPQLDVLAKDCAGRQSNPEFHSADCKDADTLAVLGLLLTGGFFCTRTPDLHRLRRR